MTTPPRKPGRPKGSTADRPKARPGRPPGSCKICDYMKTHKNCDLNRQLVGGASARSIAKEYGFGEHLVAKHMKEHLSKRLKSAANAREAKAGLDLAKCQEKVWNDAQEAIDLALGRREPPKHPYNLAVFGQCAGPQVKIIEVLAKVSPNDNSETESDGFEEALKAKAKDVWKEARPVQVATTEHETVADDDLVET